MKAPPMIQFIRLYDMQRPVTSFATESLKAFLASSH